MAVKFSPMEFKDRIICPRSKFSDGSISTMTVPSSEGLDGCAAQLILVTSQQWGILYKVHKSRDFVKHEGKMATQSWSFHLPPSVLANWNAKGKEDA